MLVCDKMGARRWFALLHTRLQRRFAHNIVFTVLTMLPQLDVNYQVDDSMLLKKSKQSTLVLRICCLNELQRYLRHYQLLRTLANHLKPTIATM